RRPSDLPAHVLVLSGAVGEVEQRGRAATDNRADESEGKRIGDPTDRMPEAAGDPSGDLTEGGGAPILELPRVAADVTGEGAPRVARLVCQPSLPRGMGGGPERGHARDAQLVQRVQVAGGELDDLAVDAH